MPSLFGRRLDLYEFKIPGFVRGRPLEVQADRCHTVVELTLAAFIRGAPRGANHFPGTFYTRPASPIPAVRYKAESGCHSSAAW